MTAADRLRAGAPPASARLPLPPVLMYHSISPSTEPDPFRLRVHPDHLDQHLRLLRRLGLRGVPLATLVEAHAGGESAGLVGLTFDDGYRDFVEHAAPVLVRHDVAGTVYVVAGRLGGTNDWDTGPQFPLLDAADVRTVAAAGHEIGSHTLGHVRLGTADARTLHEETVGSKRVLEDLVQAEVTGFCYPYGSAGPAAAEAVRAAGYDHACVIGDYSSLDRFTIPRCYIGPGHRGGHLLAKLVRHHVRTWNGMRSS
ncbi:polysaccharide deacetylase family protein [Modestobacter caceresii]|uniref:polysaccharide deacetylase family protein n=1 Tax=Modestobacter caceresii TaxID=1522368 RepID=UPI00068E8B62|nr:polysaccharide deacetylase family protein [Modestobacter caceresii]